MAKKTSPKELVHKQNALSDSLTRRPLRGNAESESESSEDLEDSEEPDKREFEQIRYKKSKPPFKLSKESKPPVELPKESKPPVRLTSFKYCFIFSVVLIVLYLFYISQRQSETIELETIPQILENMKNGQFKHQPSITHRYLKTELKKVFNVTHEPLAPAIITLIANRGAESNASDFCLYLGKKLAPGRYILINGSSYWDGKPDDIKYKIDEEIKSKYKEDQFNVIIIDKLQKIPFEAAMIFHGYCDHENSPVKRAVFLFILPLDQNVSKNASPKELDSIAISSLRNAWSSVIDDKVDSLLSRITVAVGSIH